METFPLGMLNECFLLMKCLSPQLPLSSLQLAELCIISSFWTLAHFFCFLVSYFFFCLLFYLIMIPPCNLAFSDLCLLFFVYPKLKNQHHYKKTPTKKANQQQKRLFFKRSCSHCYNHQLNVSSSLLLLIKLLSFGAIQETDQSKFKI